jgi:hypothetical protein
MPQKPVDYDALAEQARKLGDQPAAKTEVSAQHRSTGEDVAIGAGKGFGGNVLNLAQLAARINPANLMMKAAGVPEPFQMGYVPSEVTQGLKPTNKPQQVGDMLQTVASLAAGPTIAGLSRAGALGSTASKVAPAIASRVASAAPSALGMDASGMSAAEFLAALNQSKAGAATLPAASATASMSPTATKILTRGMIEATKYGVGGAMANALRRLMTGGQ